MGGTAVANYVSILERISDASRSSVSVAAEILF